MSAGEAGRAQRAKAAQTPTPVDRRRP